MPGHEALAFRQRETLQPLAMAMNVLLPTSDGPSRSRAAASSGGPQPKPTVAESAPAYVQPARPGRLRTPGVRALFELGKRGERGGCGAELRAQIAPRIATLVEARAQIAQVEAIGAQRRIVDVGTDALYVQGWGEEVHYVCEPTGLASYRVDVLVNFGTGTSNYGLGFDRAANTLWMFDDDTRELVSIE